MSAIRTSVKSVYRLPLAIYSQLPEWNTSLPDGEVAYMTALMAYEVFLRHARLGWPSGLDISANVLVADQWLATLSPWLLAVAALLLSPHLLANTYHTFAHTSPFSLPVAVLEYF
ncbi:hypothetical protein J6590_013901 [Homalodisca vitripennis]|nr:hypothetical protein J6590_013901 [Homalodisca vitripennis]